jgi:hypothetical protein
MKTGTKLSHEFAPVLDAMAKVATRLKKKYGVQDG